MPIVTARLFTPAICWQIQLLLSLLIFSFVLHSGQHVSWFFNLTIGWPCRQGNCWSKDGSQGIYTEYGEWFNDAAGNLRKEIERTLELASLKRSWNCILMWNHGSSSSKIEDLAAAIAVSNAIWQKPQRFSRTKLQSSKERRRIGISR